jgi:hypothetical protein
MVEARPLARTGRMSLPQPGSMPETKREPPPTAIAASTAQLRRSGAGVVQRVQRRSHDHGARTDALDDVGQRVVGPNVAGRRVDDSRDVPECAVDVVGGRDPESSVDVGQIAGISPDLVGVVDDHSRELKTRMRVDGPDRRSSHVPGAPHRRADHG